MAKLKSSKLKKAILILLVVIVIIFSPIIIWVTLMLMVMIGTLLVTWLLSPDPPKPVITYAEFPFEIVYEIDGDTVTVNDIYVCEYDGITTDGGGGKCSAWKGYFKSNGSDNLILLQDGNLALACSVGYPQYYMSDPVKDPYDYVPSIYYIVSPNDLGGTTYGSLDIEPILDQYKLRLVSYELSDPIENSFKPNFFTLRIVFLVVGVSLVCGVVYRSIKKRKSIRQSN